MTNNDILRKIRYIFNLSDDKMMQIFAQAETEVTRAQISDWLKKDDAPEFKSMNDKWFAIFLNGWINDKRGKKEGPQPQPEKSLNNNIIFRKMRIALSLKDEDILDLLLLADFKMSKHELSAFFRDPNHQHYRLCKDQVLRNFLMGLQLKHRKD